MEAVPEIIRASSNDLDTLAAILADAFAEDPCMNWVIPAVNLYPAFYRMLASGLYLRHDWVFMDSQGRAAALWLPPGADHQLTTSLTQLGLVARLVLHSGFAVLPRIRQAQETMFSHHPRTPHFYLHAIGVRRDCQGLGLGSALLKQVTWQCDEENIPAYLESSTPRNVPLYQRHGFEVTDEKPVNTKPPRPRNLPHRWAAHC